VTSFHEVVGVASEVGSVRPRLLDQVRERMRRLGMARRSEDAYVGWICRFILANDKRHPSKMGATEIERFLTSLAVQGNVSSSTQNQALSALLFLYRQVLGVELPWMGDIQRAKKPQRLPVVLTRTEAAALLDQLTGAHWLMASLLYGTGMRLMECIRLRVKDVDFERGEIVIRQGKGGKDRRTMLPQSLVQPLRAQLAEASRIHERDKAAGFGRVWMPDALARKYPAASLEWAWQYVFPASLRSMDPRERRGTPSSYGRVLVTTSGEISASSGGYRETGYLPHAAPLVCHASAGRWLRLTYDPGTAGPQGCCDHANLYARTQSRWAWCAEPA
jgi:integron integrase